MDFTPLDRHTGRIALSFSGGKDSTAVVYLLRDRLPEMTVYHVDTGDLLPEMVEVVEQVRAMCPCFVTIRTDPNAWMARNGMPSDLVPHSSHWVGEQMGEGRRRLVPRYDCCYRNLMRPLYDRIHADGNTLLIRGTKAVDMKRLPLASGAVSEDGIELFYPIQGWSNEQVFTFLRDQDAPISRVYDHFENAPECATCPAWWNEKRMPYLRARHPHLADQYKARLDAIAAEVLPSIGALASEMSGE